MHAMALTSIEYAWKKSKGDKQDIAKMLKTIFDKKYLPHWHCIVGTGELYVDVRFRQQQCIQITGPVKVVLFKAGPLPAELPQPISEPETATEPSDQKVRLRNPKILKSHMPAQMEQFCVKCALGCVTENQEHDLQQIIAKIKVRSLVDTTLFFGFQYSPFSYSQLSMGIRYGPNWHVAAIRTEHGSGFQDLGFDVDWLDEGFLDMSIVKYRFVIFKYHQQVILRDHMTTKNISMFMYMCAFMAFLWYYKKTNDCLVTQDGMEQAGENPVHTPDGEYVIRHLECKATESLASQASMLIFVAASVVRFALKMENKREEPGNPRQWAAKTNAKEEPKKDGEGEAQVEGEKEEHVQEDGDVQEDADGQEE
jgi:hypothetical protein